MARVLSLSLLGFLALKGTGGGGEKGGGGKALEVAKKFKVREEEGEEEGEDFLLSLFPTAKQKRFLSSNKLVSVSFVRKRRFSPQVSPTRDKAKKNKTS